MNAIARFCFASSVVFVGIVIIAMLKPDKEKAVKIGVVNYLPMLESTLIGFKQGLSDLGYAEDQVQWLYSGAIGPDEHSVEAEAARLINQERVDLLLTIGTLPTVFAKQLTQQQAKPTPVIFAPLINPVGAGIIKTLDKPGGNVTGVHNGNNAEKVVEWLLTLAPKTNYFFTFYHPDDAVSVSIVEDIAFTQQFFYPVIFRSIPVESEQDALGYLHRLPTNSSLLITPTPSLGSMSLLQQAALAQGVFVAGYNVSATYTLMSYSVDWYQQGYQASLLADRVLQGIDPSVISVEAAESYLSFNLANAHAYSFKVDPKFLKLSDFIIR
ncbi:ABC transporter substrate binding protein [Nitrincola alkalisediminis]|uniref:ABC transporter substrate binding protein n=1 Tax=Nitrincola alkalisediminis TaxID=1366656 RepID=UPI001877115C|nr:ABC transporter substrate binding protein [Nitrincola alkalisediminis]